MDTQPCIAVSACLVGEPCRYDGQSVPLPREAAAALEERWHLVPICPECLGGLSVPRAPSELQPDGRVVDSQGADRTRAFREGARRALQIARDHGCQTALLKSKSPSCGSGSVYDGSFTGRLVPGWGVAADFFAANGIRVVSEGDLGALLGDRAAKNPE